MNWEAFRITCTHQINLALATNLDTEANPSFATLAIQCKTATKLKEKIKNTEVFQII